MRAILTRMRQRTPHKTAAVKSARPDREMPSEVRTVYEFSGFRLDPGRRQLVRYADSAPIAVTPKAFDALVLLVENAGELVTRQTLSKALWPSTIVEENNLSQAVAALRRILGDGHIATVPGRGYQFVAAVRRADGPPEHEEASPAPPAAERGVPPAMEPTPAPQTSLPRRALPLAAGA